VVNGVLSLVGLQQISLSASTDWNNIIIGFYLFHCQWQNIPINVEIQGKTL